MHGNRTNSLPLAAPAVDWPRRSCAIVHGPGRARLGPPDHSIPGRVHAENPPPANLRIRCLASHSSFDDSHRKRILCAQLHSAPSTWCSSITRRASRSTCRRRYVPGLAAASDHRADRRASCVWREPIGPLNCLRPSCAHEAGPTSLQNGARIRCAGSWHFWHAACPSALRAVSPQGAVSPG